MQTSGVTFSLMHMFSKCHWGVGSPVGDQSVLVKLQVAQCQKITQNSPEIWAILAEEMSSQVSKIHSTGRKLINLVTLLNFRPVKLR